MATPQKLSEILPTVLINIRDRCNGHRRENGLPLLYEAEAEGSLETEPQEVLAVSG